MKRPTTKFVTSDNGVKVAAHDYGGDGKPTLFVHGTGLVSRMWEPIIDGIGEEFRAICIDLRAHGATKAQRMSTFLKTVWLPTSLQSSMNLSYEKRG